MSSSAGTEVRPDDTKAATGVYVYGIVPGDVEVQKSAKGVGDPPSKVDIIREGDIAALVSSVPLDQAFGTPQDLEAHAQLLDGTAKVAPVLPLRFGAVMTDAESVKEELLRGHLDEFAQALETLEGYAEYIIKGRYNDQAFLSRLLSENAQAAQFRDEIQRLPEDASRNAQMGLGELIANAVEQQRQAHTNVTVKELGDLAEHVNPREPTHEWDSVQLAILTEVARQDEIEEALDRLRSEWGDLVTLRLLGPLAPYDFVVTANPGG